LSEKESTILEHTDTEQKVPDKHVEITERDRSPDYSVECHGEEGEKKGPTNTVKRRIATTSPGPIATTPLMQKGAEGKTRGGEKQETKKR